MKNKAIVYIIRVLIQKILGLLFYLIGSHFIMTFSVALYFGFLIISTLISSLIIFKSNYETLAQRGKINTNSPKWDKVLLGVFFFLNYFIIYLIAGLEFDKEVLIGLFGVGMILCIFAGIISLKAILVNTYLESTSRIQTDRNQKVCEEGPYSVVRHPTYISIIINCIGICFIFQSIGVIICSIIIGTIIIIRTYLEDKMLKEKLDGYVKYSKKVKYRLIPYIW